MFCDEVLTALAESVGKADKLEDLLKKKRKPLAGRTDAAPDDLKPASGEIYLASKQIPGLTKCGNDAKAFMRNTLAPLIKPGMTVYEELKCEIFG